MKKNLYFKFVHYAGFELDKYGLGFTKRILSIPRTLLEVFIRKNMGERYFAFPNVILITIFLGYTIYQIAPVFYVLGERATMDRLYVENPYRSFSDYNTQKSFFDSKYFYMFIHFASWVVFMIAFVYAGYKRKQEIKRLPSVFDFGRSSIYTGDIHPFFINFRWKGKSFDIRQIETILEPLFFFIIGLGLAILQQYIGYIIIVSSFCYWVNARICYLQGDHFIMDMIDNQLFSEEKDEAFVQDNAFNNPRGVRFPGRKPADIEQRQRLADQFDDDEIAVAK